MAFSAQVCWREPESPTLPSPYPNSTLRLPQCPGEEDAAMESPGLFCFCFLHLEGTDLHEMKALSLIVKEMETTNTAH